MIDPPPLFYFHRATSPGEGGVAVFELYGEAATAPLKALFRPKGGLLPESGRARLGDLLDRSGNLLDEALVSRVPASGAWSRMDAWALSVHGGIWIQKKLSQLLEGLGGRSLDMAGVLHLALASGAMDSVEACAYELLIHAHTEKAARFFLRQARGELSARLKEGLLLAEGGHGEEAAAVARNLLAASRQAFRLGHPLSVLIAGRPNAGKSTLFNRLVEMERAIVSPCPGTTRDTLEETIALDEYPVHLTDSAGIRPLASAGTVEREGIKKVLERQDDVVLYLLPHPWTWTQEDRDFLARFQSSRLLLAASFCDLEPGSKPGTDVSISALKGEGLDELRESIVRRWIDGREEKREEVPCAPFNRLQIGILSRALELLPSHSLGSHDPAPLDALRTAYVKCLGSSWPETEY